MDSQHREELLSAYLDDELSAEDRARVEQWLAEDGEYRRLHEELLALRGDLRALPRHKLREDLAPAVLRRVEQQSPPAAGEPGLAVEAPRTVSCQWWSRRSGRTFFWPAVAVAAALLVAIFNTQTDQRDVALDDRAAGDAPEKGFFRGAVEPESKIAAESADDEAPGAASRSERQVPELKIAADADSAPLERSEERAPGTMKVAAPAAASAPADLPTYDLLLGANVETDLRRAIENREQVNLIQCDVTPAFLHEKALEKVLSGNKITYQLYAIPQADLKTNRAIRAQNELGDNDNLGYAVQATPEQVETIVTQLKQEQDRRRVSNLAVGLQQAPAPAGASPQQEVRQRAAVNLKNAQQPVTIYLRKQGSPQQELPAAPIDAPRP